MGKIRTKLIFDSLFLFFVVAKLMPMSQHYPLAVNINGSCNHTKVLSLILSTLLIIIYLDYNMQQ